MVLTSITQHWRSAAVLAFVGIAMSLSSGCTSLRIQPPERFLVLGDSGSDMIRATTPDGGKLRIHKAKTPENGTLDFWAEAVQHDLINSRGYEYISNEPITTESGLEGTCQTYHVHTDGRPHGYMIGVFAKPNSVLVAEFVAPAAVFESNREAVIKSLHTLR